MHNHLRIVLSARGVARYLGLAVLVLGVLHVVVMVVHYEFVRIDWLVRSLFDLDEEQSFGTWFSTLLLLYAALLLMLHARSLDQRGTAGTGPWWWLAAGFCLLSIDESVGLHESLNSVTEISWAIPGAIAVVIVGSAYIPFLWRLPRPTLWLFVLGGALYVGGAVGVELATESFEDDDLLDTLAYNLTTAVEEMMEMAGVVLFIHALVRHAAQTGAGDHLDIELRT